VPVLLGQGAGIVTVLAIVGSMAKAWKDPIPDEIRVCAIVRASIELLRPDRVISGRCPSGGVDIWAEQEAKRLGYTEASGLFVPYAPKVHRWEGEGGYKERDRQMAEACTHLLAIRSLWTTTYGSGWTADYARRLGRVVSHIQF
jgi:hypothetical protein